MEIFVKFEALPTITEPSEVKRLREQAGERLQRLQKSGQLIDGRMFADGRAGFLLLDIEDGAHLQMLLGGEMFDNFHLEAHPTATFEDLGRYFEENPVEGA